MDETMVQVAIQDHEKRLRELEDAIKQIAQIAEMAGRHEKILKGGDRLEDMGLQEQVRGISTSIKNASSWFKAIALLFLAQFVAVICGGIILFIQVLPILVELSTAKPIITP